MYFNPNPLALAIYGSHHFQAKFLKKSLSMKNLKKCQILSQSVINCFLLQVFFLKTIFVWTFSLTV
jgi:hypothetical protein